MGALHAAAGVEARISFATYTAARLVFRRDECSTDRNSYRERVGPPGSNRLVNRRDVRIHQETRAPTLDEDLVGVVMSGLRRRSSSRSLRS
jgi:hypothetical protein